MAHDSEQVVNGGGEQGTDAVESKTQVKATEAHIEATAESKLALLEKRLFELEARLADSLQVRNSEAKSENGATQSGAEDRSDVGVQTSSDAEDGVETTTNESARVKVVTSSVENGDRVDRDIDHKPATQSTTKDKHAILLRKYLNERDTPRGEIEIHDNDLRERLKILLAHHPSHAILTDDTAIIEAPYEMFVHNWDLLESESKAVAESEKDARVISDIRALLDVIKSGSGDSKLDTFLQLREAHADKRVVTFDNLWTIFPPGTVVYGKLFAQEEQLFIVKDNSYPWPPRQGSRRSGEKRWWTLDCYTYDFSGQTFDRQLVKLNFREFEDPKPIRTLQYFPISEFDHTPDERTKLESRLLERGRRYRDLCTAEDGNRLFVFSGKAILDQEGFRNQEEDDDSDSDYDFGRRRRRRERNLSNSKSRNVVSLNDSDVMVDFASYHRYGPNVARIGDTTLNSEVWDCQCDSCKANNALQSRFKPHYDGSDGEGQWEDLQFRLCPPRVLGYILKEKQWAQLIVTGVKNMESKGSRKDLDHLYLSGENSGGEVKNLLLGLAKNHGLDEGDKSTKSYEVQDLVADKGKGLVVLLYGAPGVGKTSTAQIIAKAAGKPLLSIGVADVDTKAKEVELNLSRIFDLATTWKAILLIDEADVFLQDRGRGGAGPSAESSGLVSVFLKVLEYYKGIMFLTTNQIAQIDVAVQSRIHIAVFYDKLNQSQTKSIFMRFVKQFADRGLISNREYGRMEDYAEDLYQKHFDGRQIRNIVSSAMGYARGDGGSDQGMLTMKHIKEVASYVDRFKNDLAGHMRDWEVKQATAGMK